MIIVHALLRSTWEAARLNGMYTCASVEQEGFIHCSSLEQIVSVANYNFKGVNGLVLLCIDTAKVIAEVRWEDLYNSGVKYPHLYGELNIDSVVKVVDFVPQEDGTFRVPTDIGIE